MFGIDIGSRQIKAVQLAKHGKLIKLVGYGVVDIPPNSITEGIISDPEALAKAVQGIYTGATWGKINAHQVAASLPEAKVFTHVLQLPAMSDAELASAVQFETEQYIPVPISDLYLDYRAIDIEAGKSDQPGTKNILLVAAPKSIVNSYLQLFELAGLEVRSLEISLQAVVRAMIASQKTGETSLIVDFGSYETAMTVYDKAIRLTGSAPLGGENLTAALMTTLKVSYEEANEIKQKFGIAPSDLQPKILAAVEPTLTTIVGEMRKIIKFYQERDQKDDDWPKIKTVVLSGGSASMPGIVEYLAERLEVSTAVGNPWANISTFPLKPVPKSVAPMFTTAIGLALREFDNE